MIGRTHGRPVSITGLGSYAPERVVTNDDLTRLVDTSDEWIMERTGIRERRVAADSEAMSDLALPAARQALDQAGLKGSDLDLVIVATVTPDMAFPATAALVAEQIESPDAAAFDLSAGCTGFMYALVQGHAMIASGLAKRALVVGGDVLSRILDWTDRSTVSSLATVPALSSSNTSRTAASSGSSSGQTVQGGASSCFRAAAHASPSPASRSS